MVDGADLWFGWPQVSDLSNPPRDHLCLHDDAGGFAVISQRSWPVGVGPADHDIDLVIERLEAIVTTQPVPA